MYVKLFSVTKAILEMAGHGHSLSQSVRLLKILNLRFDLYCSYHIPDACIVVGAFIAQGLRELFIILVFVRTVLTTILSDKNISITHFSITCLDPNLSRCVAEDRNTEFGIRNTGTSPSVGG